MERKGEVCAYHKDRIAVTYCDNCNRKICRECLFTDHVLPRFYFSFSRSTHRYLCASCYLGWQKSNAKKLHEARVRRTELWFVALSIGFGVPVLVSTLAPQIIRFLPQQFAIILFNAVPILIFFTLVFLVPYFLLYLVILRKLLGYPGKARQITSSIKPM